MASTFSSDLSLELVTTGEKAGLWGTITNTNLQILQAASSGFDTVAMGGATDVTLSLADGSATANGKNLYLKLIDTLTRNQTLIMPASTTGGQATRVFIIEDATVRTTSHFTLSVITGTSALPVRVPVGSTLLLYSDGSNTHLAIRQEGFVNITASTSVAYTAVSGDVVLVDTQANVVTITLPATPAAGDEVTIMDATATNGFATNNCIVNRNGSPIQGAATNFTMNVNNQSVTFFYTNATKGWQLKSTNQ